MANNKPNILALKDANGNNAFAMSHSSAVKMAGESKTLTEKLNEIDGDTGLVKSAVVKVSDIDVTYPSDVSGFSLAGNESGKWVAQSQRHVFFIPYTYQLNDKLIVKGHATNGSYLTFLTSNDYGPADADIDFCEGVSKAWINIGAGVTATIDIPSDCTYILINRAYIQGSSQNFFTPQSLKIRRVEVGDLIKLEQNVGVDKYNEFSVSANYSIGDVVLYDGLLYKFTSAHSAGAWGSNDVEQTTITDSMEHPVAVDEVSEADLDFTDARDNVLVRFTGGHIVTKNFDSRVGQKLSKTMSDTFVIAASDSNSKSKASADIVCDGTNDSLTIENCIKSVQGSCGTLIFCAGTYKMKFRQETSSNYAAILLPASSSWKKQINLQAQHFNGNQHVQVIFEVDQTTYEALQSTGIEYSIIKHENCSENWNSYSPHVLNHLKLQGIQFKLYDNQKPITCINCKYTGQICMYECRGVIAQRPYVGDGTLTIVPSESCVFFRGLAGSAHAFSELVRCACTGFGIGWGVQGEHIYMNSCGAINCLYGFAFNKYPKFAGFGMYVHPMMLVNCLEECGMNFPTFGANPQKQSILIYNWHIEHKKGFFEMTGGGHYATESTPGQWYGHIDYAIQYFPNSTSWNEVNRVDIPFWATGCGHSMESVNIVHKKIVTTTERNSYAPNYGQVVFDTDLNKQCICIDPDNKTWIDEEGNPVDTPRTGTSTQRPSSVNDGTMYFDTTLNKPIWFKVNGWVDANGNNV